MRSFDEQRRLQGRCCWPTPTSWRVLPPAEIERAFDLDVQLRHVDAIFDRVFGAGSRRDRRREAVADGSRG